MGRELLAVVGGLAVAFLAIFAIEMLGHSLYPLPPDVDLTNPEALRAAAAAIPTAAYALVLMGWLIGACLGGFVAVKLIRGASTRPALIVGALILAGAIYNMVTMPHPVWMVVGAVLGIIPAALVGGGLGRTRFSA